MGLQDIVPYRLPNFKDKKLLDPHVVIVGAGASIAACKIDKNGKEQRKKWAEFYDVRMMLYCNNFEETMLWDNPRVSLETLFDAILQQQPRSTKKPFKKFKTLKELQNFVETITEFDMCI